MDKETQKTKGSGKGKPAAEVKSGKRASASEIFELVIDGLERLAAVCGHSPDTIGEEVRKLRERAKTLEER